jgi:hypothetical protein
VNARSFAAGVAVGFVGLGSALVIYAKLRKPQLINSVGAATLRVLNAELARLAAEDPGMGLLIRGLEPLPQFARLKRELAYEVVAGGMINGLGV